MTRIATSAAWPINEKMASVIETEVARSGSPLSTMLDSPPVWSAEVPQQGTAAIPLVSGRIVLGASQEGDGPGTFTRLGMTNAETVDIWTADTSKRTALLIHAELHRLFHRVPLSLAGYGTVTGSWELIISMLDPSREQYHAQCRYTVTSLNPAS